MYLRDFPVMWDQWDGVVFDLDGTLVELQVEWDSLEEELHSVLYPKERGDDTMSTWDYIDYARSMGELQGIHRRICSREVRGARASVLLPLAEYLESIDRPVGVCSLNCERACRTALQKHDLIDHVGSIAGRDTTHDWKPNPAPLLWVIEELSVDPDRVVFIGDSLRDQQTTENTPVAFRSVETVLTSLTD